MLGHGLERLQTSWAERYAFLQHFHHMLLILHRPEERMTVLKVLVQTMIRFKMLLLLQSVTSLVLIHNPGLRGFMWLAMYYLKFPLLPGHRRLQVIYLFL